MKNHYIPIKNSRIHNKGIFARKYIPEGTKVIEYIGDKVTKTESDIRWERHLKEAKKNKNNGVVYLFELNKKYDIDGNVSYNTARLINHSCNPNCETDVTKGKIWVIAIKNIKKGEEITYNYCYDFEDWKDHPCKCGSENCVGYILDEKYWPKLKKVLKNGAR